MKAYIDFKDCEVIIQGDTKDFEKLLLRLGFTFDVEKKQWRLTVKTIYDVFALSYIVSKLSEYCDYSLYKFQQFIDNILSKFQLSEEKVSFPWSL